MLVSLTPAVLARRQRGWKGELVRDLALVWMNHAITNRRIPSKAEIQRLVDFCLAGITGAR